MVKLRRDLSTLWSGAQKVEAERGYPEATVAIYVALTDVVSILEDSMSTA